MYTQILCAGETLLRQPATNRSIILAEGVMYAAIRQAKAKPGIADQLASRIKDAIPIISSVQGFMGYYVIYAPDDTVTTISIFNNVASAEDADRSHRVVRCVYHVVTMKPWT